MRDPAPGHTVLLEGDRGWGAGAGHRSCAASGRPWFRLLLFMGSSCSQTCSAVAFPWLLNIRLWTLSSLTIRTFFFFQHSLGTGKKLAVASCSHCLQMDGWVKPPARNGSGLNNKYCYSCCVPGSNATDGSIVSCLPGHCHFGQLCPMGSSASIQPTPVLGNNPILRGRQ